MGGLCEERFGRSGGGDGGWGMETGGGDGSETGTVTEGEGKQKLRTGIDASLTMGFGDKEESNNSFTDDSCGLVVDWIAPSGHGCDKRDLPGRTAVNTSGR